MKICHFDKIKKISLTFFLFPSSAAFLILERDKKHNHDLFALFLDTKIFKKFLKKFFKLQKQLSTKLILETITYRAGCYH